MADSGLAKASMAVSRSDKSVVLDITGVKLANTIEMEMAVTVEIEMVNTVGVEVASTIGLEIPKDALASFEIVDDKIVTTKQTTKVGDFVARMVEILWTSLLSRL